MPASYPLEIDGSTFAPLTRAELQPLFVTICSTDDNFMAITEMFPDRHDDFISIYGYGQRADKALVSWYVDRILTDTVVDYINNNMDIYPVVQCRFENNVLDYARDAAIAEAKNLMHLHIYSRYGDQSVFPIISDYPACAISDGFISGGGGAYINGMYFGFETFISADGRLVVCDTYSYTFSQHDSGDPLEDIIIRVPREPDESDLTLDLLDDLFDEEYRGIVTHD